MNVTRKKLRKIIKEEFAAVLLEQDLFADDAGEEGEAAEDEDAAEAEESEEGEEGTPEEDEAAEEESEEAEPDVDDKDSFAKSVDDELNAIFVDFEQDAIGNAKQESVSESYKRNSLSYVLFEQEQVPQIDLETFAADVARLVKNYDSLIDMKRIILRKAKDYITKNYDSKKAKEFLDVIEYRYDMSLSSLAGEEEFAPYAIGAGSGAAGGEG